MHREQRKYVDKLEDEIAVAGGIDTVGGGSIEAKFLSHGAPVQRQGCTRHRPGTQGTHSDACGNRPVFSIAKKHFDVGQQPVPYQDGSARCRCVYAGIAALPVFSARSRNAPRKSARSDRV